MTGKPTRSANSVIHGLALAAVTASVAACTTSSAIRRYLEERYPASLIEVQNQATQGEVLSRRRGVLLVVQADVPAKKLRVLQAGPKGQRFHARDYARVDIDDDRLSSSVSGELTIPKGTALVVLDVAVKGDGVHLFLHTAKPLRTPEEPRVYGERVYGCTEIVFRVDPLVLERGDTAAVQLLIEPWLTPVASR